jgi:hypothetical protein
MLSLPCRNAWQSGEGIKKYEISSNKSGTQPTHQNIRLGEYTTFKQERKSQRSSFSLPTSHLSSKTG